MIGMPASLVTQFGRGLEKLQGVMEGLVADPPVLLDSFISNFCCRVPVSF